MRLCFSGYCLSVSTMMRDIFSKMRFALVLLLVPLVVADRIVVTNNGPIKGISVTEKKVEAFLGVPYAEPPVGPLRFAKPVPKTSWEETYIADDLPPICIQAELKDFDFIIDGSKRMSEDCLYLNIWVPKGGKDPKPILLFIHGGGYMFGSASMKLLDGSTLSEHGDVIVVTINYRVGTMGFFSGFIDVADGNMGMYDQVMAIQWIKDNAKHFGGDPDNIVLFGESAGAFSVSFHIISPLSRNLFKRAILQSGSAFHPMYMDNNELLFKGSQTIANMLGCADDSEALKQNPKDVVDCMKSLPAEIISRVEFEFFIKNGRLFPRVGDDFLPVNPVDSFRKGDFKSSEVLLGINRDEGTIFLATRFPHIVGQFGKGVDVSKINETVAKEAMHTMLNLGSDNKIIQSYLDRVGDQSTYTYLNAMSDVIGDFLVTCGAVYEADYQSLKKNPVYFYMFDYRPPSSIYAEWMGVVHFDETAYVFGNPMHKEFTEEEKELSYDMMEMWVAFARTGNPSIPKGVKWPRYTHEDPIYYIISKKDSVGVRPDNYRCEVWREFFRAAID